MPNITIREQDLTTASYNIESSDVVFIPGFISSTVSPMEDLPAAKEAIYCETIDQFRYYFGAVAPTFATDQLYSSMPQGTSWSTNAIPVGGVFAAAGTYDYGYVMALRLLGMGIPVVFARVNSDIGPIKNKGNIADIPVLTTGGAYEVNDIYFAIDENQYYQVVLDSGELDWVVTNAGTAFAGLTYVNDPSISDLYSAMLGTVANDHEDSIFYTVADKGSYNIKYLTSGGYPTFEFNETAGVNTIENVVVSTMLKVAADVSAIGRGDCIALIDHTNNPNRSLDPTNTTSVYSSVNAATVFVSNDNRNEFGAMFTPWCEYVIADNSQMIMAGSYGYLTTLADALPNNGNWLAIAGVNRGRPPYIVAPYLSTQVLTNRIADSYSSTNIAINAITEIKPYGYTIWGNRTLKNNGGRLTATSFLNIRNMISDIKKVSYSASRSLMFEQNNEILWINFKAKISPLLDRLVSGYGLQKYKLIRLASTDKTKLVAKITIYPVYAVESFDITIELRDDEASN